MSSIDVIMTAAMRAAEQERRLAQQGGKTISRKEFERKVGTWFIFGEYPNGLVDIATDENDTLFERVPRALADEMIRRQNFFYHELYKLVEAHGLMGR